MRKLIYLLFIFCFFFTILFGCSGNQQESIEVSKKNNEIKSSTTVDTTSAATANVSSDLKQAEEERITVKSPITISNNNLYQVNGRNEYLGVKMTDGVYYEDWNPGPYMGTIWQGTFVFVIQDEYGKVIKQSELKSADGEDLIFTDRFKLEFDDYNNDGDMDFTIGQYASSNGRNYRLFTLRKDGTIDELSINDTPYIFISNTTGYYSTKFKKLDKTTFQTEYYDNSVGKNFVCVFKWDKDRFKLLKTSDKSQE